MMTKRIRSYPSLLAVFFHDKSFHRPQAADSAISASLENAAPADLFGRASSPVPSQAATAVSSDPGLMPAKKELEFLLFSYLLRFVHRESPIGEFARAGIMFLMDVAFSPGEDRGVPDPLADTKLLLGEFMLDNDFADVLGAALGAAYSMLPSKLLVQSVDRGEAVTSGGMVLGGVPDGAGSDGDDARDNAFLAVAEPSASEEFQTTLGIFLSFLEFLQDVIKRGTSSSPSPAIDTPDASMSLTPQTLIGASLARAVLSAVQTTFLDHVLYPNILECSDQDGSVVAVLSYIDIILSTLTRNGPLARVILDFLIGKEDGGSPPPPVIPDRFVPAPTTPEGEEDRFTPPPSVSKTSAKHRRRKSSAMILLENINHIPRSSLYPSQGRFTLRDLILDNVGSSNPRTAIASLKLVQTMLVEYPHIGLHSLFVLAVDTDQTARSLPHTLPLSSVDNDEESLSLAGPETPESIRPMMISAPLTSDSPPIAAPLDLPDWLQESLPVAGAVFSLEAAQYLELVSETVPRSAQPPDMTSYIFDAVAALEANPALTAFQLSLLSASDADNCVARARLRISKLDPGDKLLQRMHDRLREFFVHSPEENLALTGVLASIASYPEVSLEGWLAFGPQDTASRQMVREQSPVDGTDGEPGSKDDDDDNFFGSSAPVKPRKLSDSNPFRALDQSDTQPVLLTLFNNLVRSRLSFICSSRH